MVFDDFIKFLSVKILYGALNVTNGFGFILIDNYINICMFSIELFAANK